MARKKMEPAELSYSFNLSGATGTNFISIAQCASLVNRRLYSQGKCYYVSRISILTGAGGNCTLSTLPDTWVTSNAWVKANALWKQMNQKVLSDNPSTEGKWADFKVYFDNDHVNGGENNEGPTLNLKPVDADFNAVNAGEWEMSLYTQPQHTVNTGTGEPLAADQYFGHMLGDNVAGAGSGDTIKSAGIIQGFQDTRAQVQASPLVPGDMSTSWMTLLTDDGSQEPELADVIEFQNDLPPYDATEYIGGGDNFNTGVMQSSMSATTAILSDKDLGFKVPLGLIKVVHSNATSGMLLRIHLTPGHYKGLMATEVKQ